MEAADGCAMRENVAQHAERQGNGDQLINDIMKQGGQKERREQIAYSGN